jgi:predicted S18 family serine protease
VDGPSAGAAVSVMTYSALNNLPIRSDAILTGGSTVYGGIIRVGGLFEKTMATAAAGKRYLVAPLNSISEKIILRPLKDKYNISVVEIKDVSEAIDFMIYQKQLPTNEITALMRPLPNITAYPITTKLSEFKKIAWSMIQMENYSTGLLPTSSNESKEIKNYFENEINRQSYIYANGYFFTAANEAFLNYIDIGTMNAVKSLDVDSKVEEINNCLNSIKPRQKTRDNFEYLLGSDLRQQWAIQKVQAVVSSPPELVEDKYSSYNELMYADAWCRIAQKLDAVQDGGSTLNESLWKDLAAAKLKKAADSENAEDNAEKLDSAKALYDNGKYGASIFDSVYVLAMHDADALSDVAAQKTKIAELSNQTRSSLWGQIYQSQAQFMIQTDNDPRSTLRILYFAYYLDDATNDMTDLFATGEKPNGNFVLDLMGVGIAVAFVLFSVGLYLLVMGKTNSVKKPQISYKKRRKY